MTEDNDFRIRPGPIRSKKAQRARPFIHQALAAAQKAGAMVRLGQFRSSKDGFGRGRAATYRANRLLNRRTRQAVIKARVVRHRGQSVPLKAHLRYLGREGVTQNGDKAYLFGPGSDQVDGAAFAENAADDRHHFRFIVSPEDAHQMEDLKGFTRDLMKQAEHDLGTRLNWVAVAHWNTEHPHVHIVMRGKTDLGDDLVISRDYIKDGMRARAQTLITHELGERTHDDIRQSLSRQIESERYTQLDRQMLSDQNRIGFVDLALSGDHTPDEFQVLKAGRMRKLEALGLATQFAPAQWVIADSAPTVLQALGERGDIIKRIHQSLTDAGIDRLASSYDLGTDQMSSPVLGRLIDRGLDDELRGSAYAVIDAIDGLVHHVKFSNIEACGDSRPGSIVEVQQVALADGSARSKLLIRSDLSVDEQIRAGGATWLDRMTVASHPPKISTLGFGGEVLRSLEERADYLVTEGLARHSDDGFTFPKNLLQTLRQRELSNAIAQMSEATGLPLIDVKSGDYATGIYRQRLDLASGRFAVLEDTMGFQLVPWSSVIENQMGHHISGMMRSNGSIGWDIARARTLDIGM